MGVDNDDDSCKPSTTSAILSRNKAFIFALLVYGTASLVVHHQVNSIQPGPYMDEIFHVPQCQKYCRGLYSEWDPKITTLPGTYIVASTFLRVFNNLLQSDDPCSTHNLRAFNLGVSVVNLILIYLIVGYYSPEISLAKRAFSALNIGTFPVHYFFSFLYYTDAVSTSFLLLMHYLFLRGRYGYSALAGGYSVFTRQTNIVWVLYHGINSILEVLTRTFGEKIFLYPLEYRKYLMGGSQPAKAKKSKRSKAPKRTKPVKPVKPPFHLPSIPQIWRACGDDFGDRGCNYVLVGVAFLIFVIYNGSIVVGDKQAHQATLNFPQIGYFALMFGIFTSPFLLVRMKSVMKKIVYFPYNTLFFTGILTALIYYNSPVHPYVLADNRHYTFYIWKRFYERAYWLRFVWIPFYMLVWVFIITAMGVQKVYLFTYVFCTAINIVPQLLMEFRYFIPGYLYARMTFQDSSWKELFMEFAFNCVINAATVYLFLHKPFKWADSSDVQRFMW